MKTTLKKSLYKFCNPSELARGSGQPLVGNHIVRGSVFVIGGAPGVGKSRAVTALAVAGATGADWFGLKVHRKFKTLILQAENGRKRLGDEFAALDEWVRISLPSHKGFTFGRNKFTKEIRTAIAAFKPDVVVIDPWNACAVNEQAQHCLETLSIIKATLPKGDDAPALGIVTHTRKPKGDEKTTGRGPLKSLAGSYVLASVSRAVWVMQAASNEPDDERIVWTCCKNFAGPMEKASAWRCCNGVFRPCEDFDWQAFYGSKSGSGKRGISEADVAAIFKGMMMLGKKRAVELLMERTGCVKSAAYAAVCAEIARRERECAR